MDGWMDTISAQGETGKEEVRYFYDFVRSPVIAPGFLKLSETSPQHYEDLLSFKQAVDRPCAERCADVSPASPGTCRGDGGREETPTSGLSLSRVGFVAVTPLM